MPLIPDDFQQQTEVREGPSAGLQESSTPAEFGQPVGQAIGIAGEVATKLHFDATYAANRVAVNDALNKVDAAGQSALRDPQHGLFYQQTGAQAPAAAQKTMSDLQQQVGKVRASLNNDQQREDFDLASRHITDQWAAHSDAYVGTQLEDHTKNVAVQTLSLADKAIADNPDAAQERIAGVKASVETTAAALHYTPGTEDYNLFVQQHSQEAAAQLSKTAVQAYIAQNRPGDAQRYLDKYGSDLPVPMRDELSKQATAASTEQQGQAIAMGFLQGSQSFGETVGGAEIPGSGGLFDRKKFNDQLENDPRLSGSPEAEKLREAVERHGNALIEQHQRAVDEANDQSFQQSYKEIQAAGGVVDDPTAARISTLPAAQQEKLYDYAKSLTEPEVKAQSEYEKYLAQNAADEHYGDFFLRAHDNPDWAANMTSSQYYTQYHDIFTKEQYGQGLKVLAEARKGGGGGMGEGTTLSNADINQAAQTAGLTEKEQGAFITAATKAMNDRQDALGDKPVPDKERQQIISTALADKVFVPGVDRAWYNPVKYVVAGTNYWLDGDNFDAKSSPDRKVPVSALTPEEAARVTPQEWIRRTNQVSKLSANQARALLDASSK